jgi:hypothetical protein
MAKISAKFSKISPFDFYSLAPQSFSIDNLSESSSFEASFPLF